MDHNVVFQRGGNTVTMSEADWTQLLQDYPNLKTSTAALAALVGPMQSSFLEAKVDTVAPPDQIN